jgi:hypothetical protein
MTQSFSWNTHALITKNALTLQSDPRLDESIEVSSLENFLDGAHAELLKFSDNVSGYSKKEAASGIRTEQDFLIRFRLNPLTKFSYVRNVRFSDVPHNTEHSASRSGPPAPGYITLKLGRSTSIREVIIAYSDEPDWGMDQDLYSVEHYRYGPCPFGAASGPSSQAAFHMAFLHESQILTLIFPGLRKSYIFERIRSFAHLSTVAFEAGHTYWGARFAAWVLHYVQDLTQPFHAKAFPSPILPLLGNIIKDGKLKNTFERHKAYLSNRHYFLETVVHFLLNEAERIGTDNSWVNALQKSEKPNVSSLSELVRTITALSAEKARNVDSLVASLGEDINLTNSLYDIAKDRTFDVVEVIRSASNNKPVLLRQFISELCALLELAGACTRYIIDHLPTTPGASGFIRNT